MKQFDGSKRHGRDGHEQEILRLPFGTRHTFPGNPHEFDGQSAQILFAVQRNRPARAGYCKTISGRGHIGLHWRISCIRLHFDVEGNAGRSKAAQADGISFFPGEAEGGRLDKVLQDAFAGDPKPIYDRLADLPGMESTPIPYVPKDIAQRAIIDISSFDPARGCPFQCSLCSIVNVHDRKSRFRTADDLRAKRPHNGLKKGKFNVSAPCQHSQSAFFQKVSSALNHAQFFFRQLKARVQHEHHAWL